MEIDLKSLQKEIMALPQKPMNDQEQAFIRHYLGTKKKVLGVKIGELIKIAKEIVKVQDKIEIKNLIYLISGLLDGETFEEHAVGGKIFTLLKPAVRSKISFDQLEKWLVKTRGWVEVDVICQSTYTVDEVLARWSEWEKTIKKFSRSPIIAVRRASLVLENPAVGRSDNSKIRRLAFATIEKLKGEKDVLITKAISWLLRSLANYHQEEVKKYLLQNESTLPRIAFRETMKKIETGKKTARNIKK